MTRAQAIKKYNLHRDYFSDDWKKETYSADTMKDGIRTAYHLEADELALSEGELLFFLHVQKWDCNQPDEDGFPKPLYNRVYEIAI